MLSSPDGRIQVQVSLVEEGETSRLQYQVAFEGRPVVAPSAISFVRGDGAVIGDRLVLVSMDEPTNHHSTWKPVYGEREVIEDCYNQIAVDCHDTSADCPIRVVFRCYNAGIAFRVVLGSGEAGSTLGIRNENVEFRFYEDHPAWCTHSAQGDYHKKLLSKIHGAVERPLVIQVDEKCYAALAEAKLVDYARMKIRRAAGDSLCLVSSLDSSVKSSQPLETPWRVVMLGSSPGELLENNDIFLNLSDPCEIADTSWIQPGKVIRDVTLTNEGARACIDFAAEHNLQYVEFDAGWYGKEDEESSDATTVTLDPGRSQGPFDLHHLIEYANERDVGVILYVNRRALERQLDVILPLYKEWGVAGVKYGFVQVGSQKWTSWLHEAIRKAAKYQLMVDVHDEYRPTGYSRTYPNLMTQEGVRGDEASPSAVQAVTTLFTRNLAGASDRTVCYFDHRVVKRWSYTHQLAKAVCNYSPWQFLFWYDTPLKDRRLSDRKRAIKNVPELKFFRRLPTTWDETKVISGEMDGHAVIARRSGADWFVGAMNGSEPTEIELPLSFLKGNQEYVATVYSDDPEHDEITSVNISCLKVDSHTTLDVSLQSNSGQAIWVTPASNIESADTEAKGRIAVGDHGVPNADALP